MINNSAFQSKAGHLPVCVWLRSHKVFCSCDLDLDPMTLINEIDLDVLTKYLHTNNDVSRSMLSQARARRGQTDRQTDETERITTAAFTGSNENQQQDDCVVPMAETKCAGLPLFSNVWQSVDQYSMPPFGSEL